MILLAVLQMFKKKKKLLEKACTEVKYFSFNVNKLGLYVFLPIHSSSFQVLFLTFKAIDSRYKFGGEKQEKRNIKLNMICENFSNKLSKFLYHHKEYYSL